MFGQEKGKIIRFYIPKKHKKGKYVLKRLRGKLLIMPSLVEPKPA